MANCTRWDGLASTFAPQSIRRIHRLSSGSAETAAGALRRLDASYDRLSADQDCSGASDETNASASQRTFSCRQRSKNLFVADRIDRRLSRISMISVAGTISTRSFVVRIFRSSFTDDIHLADQLDFDTFICVYGLNGAFTGPAGA